MRTSVTVFATPIASAVMTGIQGSAATSSLTANTSQNLPVSLPAIEPGLANLGLLTIGAERNISQPLSSEAMQGRAGVATGPVDTSALEVDWLARASGSQVIWFVDFRSDAEVDAFRWSSGYGNDPLSVGTYADDVRRITSDGLTGGGCLECLHPTGSAGGSYWYRPMAALTAESTGRATDDPAGQGLVPVRELIATDGGSQTANFSGGGHGPVQTGPHDGNQFYFQVAMKIEGTRQNNGLSGGKTWWLTRTNETAAPQELVYSYKFASDDVSFYTKVGADEILDSPYPPHYFDEWVTHQIQVIPGEEEDVPNTTIRIWRQREADADFTLMFETTTQTIDYRDGQPKNWNAVILAIYHNNQSSSTEFYQRFDQAIFSHDFIPARGMSTTDLHSACAGLSEGESVDFSAGEQTSFIEDQMEWQTSFWHDPINNRVHLVGKQAGTSSAWPHQYYDVLTGSWVSVTSSLTGGASRLGHIYGNTGFDWYTGALYHTAGDARTQQELYGYDPEADSWSTITADFAPTLSGGGDLNDTNNGVAVHPQLFGPNRPGVIVDNQINMMFYDLTDGSDYTDGHSSNLYGAKEGGWVYWQYHNCVIIGGSAGGDGRLAMVEPNGQATPIVTTLNAPPLNVQGASQENSSGFASLHVHPGNPTKLLLLETTGSLAYTGTLSGSTITWTQISNHPFTQNARVLCSLRGGLNCMWMIARDGAVDHSTLWRPPA